MTPLMPRDPDFAARIRATFDQQAVMHTLNATLQRVEPGLVEIVLPFGEEWTQQHGFMHAGILTTVVDTACGAAAAGLMPAGMGVVTVEYKVNFLTPAQGEQFLARGRVIKSGRTLTFCAGEILSLRQGHEQIIVTFSATMMAIQQERRSQA